MKKRRKRIFGGVALAFAVGLFAVPIAQAKPIPSTAASQYSWQQLRALELRSQGMNERYGLSGVTPTTRATPQQMQDELRFQGVSKADGLTGQKTSNVQSSTGMVVASSSSSGFDWGDAFVGAAVTFAAAIVFVAAFATLRRRHQPVTV